VVTFKNQQPANDPADHLDVVGHRPKAAFPSGMVGIEAQKNGEIFTVGLFSADALASVVSKLIQTGETIWGESMKAELTKHGITIKPVE